ncbi:MAG: hypothetical protein Q8O89_02865 [Nanoarchaeota archaeon]|nr:hypothetical protein [Nanoarchaeota archaeon]
MAKKKQKNPITGEEQKKKETEKRRRKIFGKFYDRFTQGKTEEEIAEREARFTNIDEYLKKKIKEGRIIGDE